MISSTNFDWQEAWLTVPTASYGGEFPGHACAIVYAPVAGEFILLSRANPAVHRYDLEGALLGSWGHPRLQDGHGLSLATAADGTETLWATDRSSGLAGEFTLDGHFLRELPQPQHAAYEAGKSYKPTWVAAIPHGGDIWLADGYGANLLHHYSGDGSHLASFDGTQDPGLSHYGCPHGIAIRPGPNPELWLADRNASRVRIYNLEGHYLRHIDGIENWPCSFAFHDDLVAIPCLRTGVRLLRGETPISDLAPNDWAQAGWPAESRPTNAETALPNRFHAPHGACFGPDGSLLVAELKEGGRVVRLVPA